ncbi:MAG: hypothetical protein C5B49_07905 [Bdellovibrio sp.]|nr:MAG: hypothetical protein C5B49_07905 [Bdellovibrio sp.]
MEKAIFNLMQKALGHFAGPDFRNEVQFAKGEFFAPMSVPDDTLPSFEYRMQQFYDWYFFTRPLRGFTQSPLEALFMTRELRFTPEETALIEKLRQHRHSLFEFLKRKGESLVLKDLLKNEKIIIESPNFSVGFEPGAIFETRLIPIDKIWIFARGFCFHPLEARKYILSEVKRHRRDPDLDRDELMLDLFKKSLRTEQYKHVPLEKIYSAEGVGKS